MVGGEADPTMVASGVAAGPTAGVITRGVVCGPQRKR